MVRKREWLEKSRILLRSFVAESQQSVTNETRNNIRAAAWRNVFLRRESIGETRWINQECRKRATLRNLYFLRIEWRHTFGCCDEIRNSLNLPKTILICIWESKKIFRRPATRGNAASLNDKLINWIMSQSSFFFSVWQFSTSKLNRCSVEWKFSVCAHFSTFN